MYMYVCVHMGKLGPIMAHQPIGRTKFWAHNEPWACLGHHGPWGAQVWAHSALGKLGPIMAHGGPKLGPTMGPGQAWAHHGPRGGPSLSFGPSWSIGGGDHFGPIMGPGQVWAHHGP